MNPGVLWSHYFLFQENVDSALWMHSEPVLTVMSSPQGAPSWSLLHGMPFRHRPPHVAQSITRTWEMKVRSERASLPFATPAFYFYKNSSLTAQTLANFFPEGFMVFQKGIKTEVKEMLKFQQLGLFPSVSTAPQKHNSRFKPSQRKVSAHTHSHSHMHTSFLPPPFPNRCLLMLEKKEKLYITTILVPIDS